METPEISVDTAHIREALRGLKAGDRVLLSGTVYTARDAAHLRLCGLIHKKQPLPIDLTDAVLYYAAPSPPQQGMPFGSCGPTTAHRMDRFTPKLLNQGVAALIGKGDRCQAVEIAIRENAACYFAAVGGSGALMAQCIEGAEVVAFPELGCEAIYRLTVLDFPLLVAIDCRCGNLYHSGRALYRQL